MRYMRHVSHIIYISEGHTNLKLFIWFTTKVTVFWDVTPCILVDGYWISKASSCQKNCWTWRQQVRLKHPYASTKLHGVKITRLRRRKGGHRRTRDVPQVLPTQQRLIFEQNRRTAERIRQLSWLLRLVIDHRDESVTWVAAAFTIMHTSTATS